MQIEANKTILLVEDEAIIAMTEKISLEEYGYSVITALTGEEAVNTVKTIPEIDLILMDINLGDGIDGTQTAEIILKKHDIPILFLSSHIEPEIVEKTEKISSYGYVVKSSSITVIDASIKMAFKLFKAHREINQQNALIKAGNENLNATIEELETSRNRLSSVFRAAPTGIGVIVDRTIIEINQRICEMTGYNQEELVGKKSRILYPTQQDFDFVGKEKYKQIKQKGTGTVETRWKCKNGEIIDVLLSSTPLDTTDLKKGVTFTALDITKRKQFEKHHQEGEEKFSKIFQGSPYPIMIIDIENGQFTDVNDTMVTQLEYTKDEIIGKNAVELGIIDPATELQTKKLITETGHYSNLEISIKTKTGKSRSALASGQIVEINKRLYLIQTIMDVTVERTTKKALVESEKTLSFVMDGVPALLAYMDTDLRFIYVNQAHADWHGKDKSELIGKSLRELLPEDAYNRGMPQYTKVLKGETVFFENKTFNAKGEERYLSVRLLPNKIDGEVKGFFAALNDITESKHNEEKIEKELSEKENLLKEVHHRIKNNISSIENLLILQMQDISNVEAISALQDAITRVQGMRIIYDKLLISDDYKNLSVKEYFEHLVDAISTVFSDNAEIAIDEQIEDFDLSVNTLIPLGIIMNELLTNTFKYAFKEMAAGRIMISISKTKEKVTLEIQDNGIGLSEDFDLSRTSGFGLKIVLLLTKQLGGTFSIDKNEGTRSILNFPI